MKIKTILKSELFSTSIRRLTLFGFFACCFFGSALAQLVSGTVIDKNNEAIIGASITIKGTTSGTITDATGNFSIKVTSPKDILQFSYIGYISQTIVIGTQKTIKVVLDEKSKDLDEVIVVGYGSQKKSDLTGSVVSVKADEMNSIPTTSVAEMLRGQAAGLVVTQNSDRPGGGSDIVIRGNKTLPINGNTSGNAPLFIVDGVPVQNIDDYNSQDILSVEVLKDASSEAIYGARASNGVILVTTKKGTENKTTVEFSTYLASQQMHRNFSFYSPEEWMQLKRQANRTYTWGANNYSLSVASLGTPDATGAYPGDQSLFGPMWNNFQNKNYNDWEALGIKPALQQKYDLSVRSGNKDTKIAASLGYFDQKGMIAPADYQRATFHFNVQHKLTKNLTFGLNTNYTYSGRDQEDATFNTFITESPLLSPGYANLNNGLLENSKYSPIWNNANQTDHTVASNLLLNGFVEWEIIKGLKYKINGSLNTRSAEEGVYLTSLHQNGIGVNGLATIGTTNYSDYLLENILTYDGKINADNKFDITLVQSTDLQNTTFTQEQGSGFATDALGYNFIGSASNANYPVLRTISPTNLLSYMGRIRYNLKDKYLFSVSARMDGSSVFGVNNKWGTFPAASVGWRMSEEDFLKDKEWLSNLKIRASYGSVGNQKISPYQTQGLATPVYYQFGSLTPLIGYLPGSQLPNPDLKWETTTTLNTGVDFSFLNDRVGGTVEYYHALTTDLLNLKSINQTSGYSTQLVNMGNVLNQGLEVTLNFVPVKTKDFTWTLSVNFAANQNKIVKLNGATDASGNDLSNKWFVGHNINSYYDYQYSKIMQYSDSSAVKKIYYPIKPNPGDVLVKDVDQNDTINAKDYVIMDQDSKWTGGLSSTLKWKGIDFSFDIYTVQGALKRNLYLYDYNSGGSLAGVLNGIKVDYWTLENQSTTAPRPRDATIQYFASMGYQDASYIRLRNISLGYTFPKSILHSLKMTNLRIYGSATNLLTITKFLSYSPEASAGAYPEPQTFTVGLNVTF
jgi:TonB-linked SusC/RagA family outer membrane protein